MNAAHPGGELFRRFCPHLDESKVTGGRQRQVPFPGGELFRHFCPHLDWPEATESRQRQVPFPGRELFHRLCPHLDWPEATESRQRQVPFPGRELFHRLCPHLDEKIVLRAGAAGSATGLDEERPKKFTPVAELGAELATQSERLSARFMQELYIYTSKCDFIKIFCRI